MKSKPIVKKTENSKSAKKKGLLFVFTGTSGSGKTTLMSYVLKDLPFCKRIVTCTTRAPRAGEKHGVDYYFISKEKFEEYIKKGALLEYAVVYGNYYGSLRSEVEELINYGKSVIVCVDVQGAKTMKKVFPSSVVIFIKAPSLEVLKKRLEARGKDSPQVIETRLNTAKKELKLENDFDYLVVNDALKSSVDDVKKIIADLLKIV
jgi:guanylate kinase